MDEQIMEKSELTAEDVALKFRRSFDHLRKWRKEAREAYDYVAGKQWSDEDQAIIDDKGVPAVTFNRAEVFVSAITGLEVLNRLETRYIPRQVGPIQSGETEVLSSAVKYVEDDCLANTHRSDAFRDLVICGMGWTITRLDSTYNPDGEIKIERRDPLYCVYDIEATQKNISDSMWRGFVKPMSQKQLAAQFGEDVLDKVGDRATFSFFDEDDDSATPHHRVIGRQYEIHNNTEPREEDDADVWVAQYQYCKLVDHVRVRTPMGNQDVLKSEFDAVNAKADELGMPKLPGKTFKRKKYYQAIFIGDYLYEDVELVGDEFTLQCLTGKHDRNRNVWYGIMRNLTDPQKWVNKLFSEFLYIIMANAKGGLLAERGAFTDPSRAEDDWSKANSIIWLNDGSLTNGKIQERSAATYPVGIDKLLQFAMAMPQEVTGVPLELLGTANRDQPGIVEQQRKQAAMTTLSWAFDAMRDYMQRNGKVLAAFIREYIADDRLVRIVGKNMQQYIKLSRDVLAAEYDVIVDSSPQSTNEKERTFAIIMQLLPMFAKMNITPPDSIMDYLPIPTSLSEEWKKKMQPDPMQGQIQQAQMQLQMEDAQAEVQGKQAQAQKTQVDTALQAAKVEEQQLKNADMASTLEAQAMQ